VGGRGIVEKRRERERVGEEKEGGLVSGKGKLGK
jgi:hypothetical protein